MKFKPGDRVAFLNEKGGGVIARIVDEKIAYVSIEDGFEIPYALTDLLKVGDSMADMTRHIEEEDEVANPDQSPLFSVPNKLGQIAAGAYLAIVPADQEQLLQSPLDFYLVNHTDSEMLFGIYLNRSGNFHGIEYGFVEADSKLFIRQDERNQIEDWPNGLVQIMFFGPGKTVPVKPASASISFKPVKIYKEDSFPFDALLRKKAMMVPLALLEDLAIKAEGTEVTTENIKFLNEKITAGTRKQDNTPKVESLLDKHKVDDRIAEVDLHITELSDSISGLSNVEMLKIQMDYFRRCMEQAEVEKMSKMIFIHGVGNGTLKNEILRYLRNTPGVEFYDAAYARYGMGATEVFFYRNK
ncbi:MAG: DUF2027 domain-containing protein [Bacteroidales bacterium]|jgi:hypothetical protein|nr:DUF2027 domain-containing protein [Bacteroidales bacterium]NLM91472.1 DUF2027 domain-containing protein [Bacteroidales bacterium]